MADEDAQGRDWRDAETYRPLLCADASALAWEFARRAAGPSSAMASRPPDLCYADERPGHDGGPLAIWRFETDPTIPLFQALAAGASDPQGVDVATLRLPTVVITSDAGDQHVLVADGARRLRFAVTGDDVLEGPVRLGFMLPGPDVGAAGLPAIQGLLALRDSGRLPAGASEGAGRARRWTTVLQALDARRAGASQRQIAGLVFGQDRAAADWNGASDYMRMRIHRLLRSAERMAAGGYRAAFGLLAPERAPRRLASVWRSMAQASERDPRQDCG